MTDQPVPTDITSDDKLWSALGYPVPIIAIIALLMEDKKTRPFIKYHAIQSLAFNVILWVVIVILSATVVLSCFAWILWFATLWPAIKAYQGEYLKLPVITDFIKNQGWI